MTPQPPAEERAAYLEARAAVVARLAALLGADTAVPLGDVVLLLPTNPEWARYCPTKNLKRRPR